MQFRALIIIAFLLCLMSCAGGGYSRPYIITDTTGEEVVTDSVEKR